MAGILPLLIALITAHAAGMHPPPLKDGNGVLVVVSVLLFSALHVLLSALLVAMQRPALIRSWDVLGLGLLLGLNAWWCLSLGWTQASAWSVIILAPMMGGLCVHWYSLGVASGSGWGAGSLWALWLRLRLVFLPVLLLTAISDVFQWVVRLGQLEPFWETSLGAWLLVLASIAAPILALTFLPPLLVRLWGARPPKPGRQADDLRAWCQASEVPLRAIMVWPARGLPFYNACVLGLWSRFRYILISEDLLRDCPPEEIKAVLGHELGHARHGHLWFYLLFLMASGLWAQIAADWVTALSVPILPSSPHPLSPSSLGPLCCVLVLACSVVPASVRPIFMARSWPVIRRIWLRRYIQWRITVAPTPTSQIGVIIPSLIVWPILAGCATHQNSNHYMADI